MFLRRTAVHACGVNRIFTRCYSSPTVDTGLVKISVNHDSYETVKAATEMVKKKLYIQLDLEQEVVAYDQQVTFLTNTRLTIKDLMDIIAKIYTLALHTSIFLDTDVLLPFAKPPTAILLENLPKGISGLLNSFSSYLKIQSLLNLPEVLILPTKRQWLVEHLTECMQATSFC